MVGLIITVLTILSLTVNEARSDSNSLKGHPSSDPSLTQEMPAGNLSVTNWSANRTGKSA